LILSINALKLPARDSRRHCH